MHHNTHIQSVELPKSYRLLNHGPTVLVSAKSGDTENVMAASWACALEFSPAKVTVVLDKSTRTRQLVEESGYFALQVPCLAQIDMTKELGTLSLFNEPNKLEQCGTKLFYQDGLDVPLVEGCIAWLVCKLIPESHNQQEHDLFIGSVVGAWADDRVFRDGHWYFDDADPQLKSLHYIAGGTFYTIGDEVKTDK